MMIFCTLFNSGYLDKGIVMFRSLQRAAGEFKLYIVAFDDKCYDVLTDYENEQIIPIRLSEFEDDRLLRAKKNRTQQEYCWTCSCHAIKYVLETYQEKVCTYIDADMYFYRNPQCLFDEITAEQCDVGIIEHRLSNNVENRRVLQLSGRFCVEFNTFYATDNGKKILNWWCDRCIELCTAKPDGVHFGDQKYLDDWQERFHGVHVIQHPGAGVAPWNVAQYQLAYCDGDNIFLVKKKTKEKTPLIFYHFQAMQYHEDGTVDIGINLYPGLAQVILYRKIYREYLQKIEEERQVLLEKYGLDLGLNFRVKFDRKKYFFQDILGERNPFIMIRKMWRLFVRKNRDYIKKSGM